MEERGCLQLECGDGTSLGMSIRSKACTSTRHIRDGEGLLQLSSIYADKVEVRLIHLLHEIEAIFIAICKLGHVSFFADLYKEKE